MAVGIGRQPIRITEYDHPTLGRNPRHRTVASSERSSSLPRLFAGALLRFGFKGRCPVAHPNGPRESRRRSGPEALARCGHRREGRSIIAPALIDAARAAQQDVAAAQARATEERNKFRGLRGENGREQAERERLRSEKEQDDALRLIDGEDAVPKRSRRDNRLAKLDEEAAAKNAAIRIQELRAAEADNAARLPQMPFIASVLNIAAEVQGDGVEAVRSALAGLAPTFARLIAGDQLRGALLGDRHAIPPGASPPFSGITVLRNTVKAIPERLLPSELSEERLFEAAREISSDIINQIKGN